MNAVSGTGAELLNELTIDNMTYNPFDRDALYGHFEERAQMSQALKSILQNTEEWDELDDKYRESLEFILMKISRIVLGDPEYVDNWRDIIGYVKLVCPEAESEPEDLEDEEDEMKEEPFNSCSLKCFSRYCEECNSDDEG